jgi:Kef-type K+ transport system membrane component KefB
MVMNYRFLIFYILLIIVSIGAIWGILEQGHVLETQTITPQPAPQSKTRFHVEPFGIFIIQIIVIILLSRIFSALATKIGQPKVMGEIVAGILLGPSLLGLFFPEIFNFIFPAQSVKLLGLFSQIGILFFMFIIGMELDIRILKNKAHSAVVISHASIIFPYVLGMALSFFLYVDYANNQIPFSAFALFMGIAMSITAFPVLARILKERKLTTTPVGSLVMSCAAADDVTAWFLLAFTIAFIQARSYYDILITIIISVVYFLLMLFVIKPYLERISTNEGKIKKNIVALVFLIVLVSSLSTELIGIHALFGAFLAGIMMPQKEDFRKQIANKIEDFNVIVLLPLFFAASGLKTEINLINSTDDIIWCILITLIAIIGKFLGSAIAARFVGESTRNSLVIGALMNTRGLMELIVLNIGYDIGILPKEIFTMMVIMALVTTFMTGPALNLLEQKPKSL